MLSSTTDYLSSLRSQVAELTKRNMILESQMNSVKKSESGAEEAGSSSSGERIGVEIAQVSSEARLVELRVTVRGECSLLDLVGRLIEFLRGESSVSLTSVESHTRMPGSLALHVVMMRLRLEVRILHVYILDHSCQHALAMLSHSLFHLIYVLFDSM